MDVTCERCNTEYEFDDALVSEQGTSVRCTQCGHRFKVRRSDAVGAPEVWIVRTVEGSTLEFRALRDLKTAIAGGRVGKDDVLSRGAGRPRRLASIAELEPFFGGALVTVSPAATTPHRGRQHIAVPSVFGSDEPPASRTKMGLGTVESLGRPRAATPPGLGPVASFQRGDQSVAIPLGHLTQSAIPPPSDSEPTAVRGAINEDLIATTVRTSSDTGRQRQATRELRALHDTAPQSVEPVTLPEPSRFPSETGPATIAGISPQHAARSVETVDPLTRTQAYGTPSEADAAHPAAPALRGASGRSSTLTGVGRGGQDAEPTSRREAESTRESRTSVRPEAIPQDVKLYAAPEGNGPPVPLDRRFLPSADRESGPVSRRADLLPPPPAETGAAHEESIDGEPSNGVTPPPNGAQHLDDADEQPRRSSGRRGMSLVTPSPSTEIRYSALGDEGAPDVMPSERRPSSVPRRPVGSMRVIVALLVGGALLFVGVLFIQRYARRNAPASVSQDTRVDGFLEAGEKALREGDLDGAQEQFVKASALAESDPRVTKALARLAAVRAEIPWLEMLLLPPNDPGRDAVRRRYLEAGQQAMKAAQRAVDLAPDDPEVARVLVDVKRLQGDVAAARKLVDKLRSLEREPETLLVMAALDLAGASPDWPSVITRLSSVAEQEGNLGRARTLLVYALARSGDAKRSRAELEKLAKLPKAHPLEAQLRRFVERAEKGEDMSLRTTDLPSIAASGAASSSAQAPSSPANAALLKSASDALAKGQLDKADDLYKKVLETEPENSEALAGAATVARQRGRAKDAITLNEKVLASNPNYVPAIVSLADLKWESGDQASARALYRRALDIGLTGAEQQRAMQRANSTASTGGWEPTPPPTQTSPTPTTTTQPTQDPVPQPTNTTPPSTGDGDVPPWEGDPK
ncbi:MAG: zinc-ribbon domain-containing protein [Polyangiaceae bacterium]